MKKKDIVKSQQDFNKIIKQGKQIANSCFVIYYKDNPCNKFHSRFGISVGTKLGNAVFRNKYKRKVRMIVTNNIKLLYDKKNDYVIIVRKGATYLEQKKLETSFINLANQLKEI